MASVGKAQRYYINSENRISGSSSDFIYRLVIPEGGYFDSVCVLSVSIPLSFYLIRSPYNTMILQEGMTSALITVPEGNYSARSFITDFTLLLNAASPNGWIYSMSLDSKLAKYNYSVTGNSGIQPKFILSNHLGDQTGFNLDSTNTFVDDTLISDNVLNFVSTNCLYLHSNMVADKTSILQEVFSNNTVPFSFITWSCPDVDLYSKLLVSNKDNSFSFTLTDEHGSVIDLNGQNIQFTLLLFKKVDINAMFRKWLEITNI